MLIPLSTQEPMTENTEKERTGKKKRALRAHLLSRPIKTQETFCCFSENVVILLSRTASENQDNVEELVTYLTIWILNHVLVSFQYSAS